MPVELVTQPSAQSRPVILVRSGLTGTTLDEGARRWAQANAYAAEAGKLLLIPDDGEAIKAALFGVGERTLDVGALARLLPEGDWHFHGDLANPALATLAVSIGGYAFTRYGKKPTCALRLAVPPGVDAAEVIRIAGAVGLARDLINTPTNDMGPHNLEAAARALAEHHGATVTSTIGDDLLTHNFPMIHAVGRAAGQPPRLVDLRWGPNDAPKVTLVGKGVCFDTGGLDIKPSSGMLLMKKDMGGAANVLGLASLLMSSHPKIRLRVLLPIVENSISATAFRPGDVLKSRKGLTVEIGNTDAEGRLILADALTLADEEAPDLLIDMATLTGAARVALGPDLPPFYTDDNDLAQAIAEASQAVEDPLWRMPLWRPYDSKLSSKIADLNNVTTDGFAGSITAALFLARFVQNARSWVHFDIFGWNPHDRPHGPTGGEAQGIRALAKVIAERFAR